jgi:2-keto-4-pentenoate hydratase
MNEILNIGGTVIERLASRFLEAYDTFSWTAGTDLRPGSLSIKQAYMVQDVVTRLRRQRGEQTIGFKVGCTSQAIRTQFGLSEPIYGRLFDRNLYSHGAAIDRSAFLNCAIEPEMVIRTRKDLRGENLSDEELVDGIESVRPGIELHHFKFWFSPTTSQELICSGGIHAGLVIGRSIVSPGECRFTDEMFSVFLDGRLITQAPASEIMGGPLNSMRWLIACLTKQGKYLKAESLIIPGSPVELVPIESDAELTIKVAGVGSAHAKFEVQPLKPSRPA